MNLLEHPVILTILNNPEDWDSYLVFSDILLEQGQDQAALGFRWMGVHKTRPFKNGDVLYWQSASPERTGYVCDIVYRWIPRSESRNLIESAMVLGVTLKTIQGYLGIGL